MKIIKFPFLVFTLLLIVGIVNTGCSTDESSVSEETEVITNNESEVNAEEEEEPEVDYTIGDIGPAGGVVFYDKGEYTDGWRYMEAAPEDIEGANQWGCLFSEVPDSQELGIGFGLANSEAILAFHDALNNFYGNPEQCGDGSDNTGINNGTVAAKIALEYEVNGYDNWHLPLSG